MKKTTRYLTKIRGENFRSVMDAPINQRVRSVSKLKESRRCQTKKRHRPMSLRPRGFERRNYSSAYYLLDYCSKKDFGYDVLRCLDARALVQSRPDQYRTQTMMFSFLRFRDYVFRARYKHLKSSIKMINKVIQNALADRTHLNVNVGTFLSLR